MRWSPAGTSRSRQSGVGEITRVEAVALVYVALPTIIFVAGWIVFPWGVGAASVLIVALVGLLSSQPRRWSSGVGPMMLPVVLIAGLWVLLGGGDHLVYANLDWVVRDAVLVDLTRASWPVHYRMDAQDLLLRAPIGYFLPAAVFGKLWGIRVAEHALMVWTAVGVSLTFAMTLRDRPPPTSALIRIAIFIVFSGMDIVGSLTHHGPPGFGQHLEWWAFLFQYSSQTTQLFWVPNHALPGWIAIAWLLGQDPKRLSTTTAILFVAFVPLWSPLTAIGLAPIVAVALVHRMLVDRPAFVVRALLDWRMLAPVVVCLLLVFPYLIAGSDQVPFGTSASVPWVGEDFVPRYLEFVIIEFAGIAALLVARSPRDPLLWTAIAMLLVLPFYHFGPGNDLAMRGSIVPLTLLAIRMGQWLSTPLTMRRQPRRFMVAVVLLAIGAVTPLMEFARAFQNDAWPLDTHKSLVDVTRGTHYLTDSDRPWIRRFLNVPEAR